MRHKLATRERRRSCRRIAVAVSLIVAAVTAAQAEQASPRLQQEMTKVIEQHMDAGVVYRPTHGQATTTNPYVGTSATGVAFTGTPTPATLVAVPSSNSARSVVPCALPLTSTGNCLNYTLPAACSTASNCYKTSAAGAGCTTTDAVCQPLTSTSDCTGSTPTTTQFCASRTFAPACATTMLPACDSTSTGYGASCQPTSASGVCVPYTDTNAGCSTQMAWCQNLSSAVGTDCSKTFSNSSNCMGTYPAGVCELTYQIGCMNTDVGGSNCTVTGVCQLTYGNNCATDTTKGICHKPAAAGTPGSSGASLLLAFSLAGCSAFFARRLGAGA